MDRKYFLSVDNYGLRPLEAEDVDGPYQHWLNDAEITLFNSHGRFPQSKALLLDYIQHANNRSQLTLALDDTSNTRHIGNISLQGINWVDRNAEIAFLLGDREYLGKGVMYLAGKLLIKHAFSVLNLHRIYCGTSSENIGMQKLAIKLGMMREGIRKEALFKFGKYLDIIEFGIISNTHNDNL